MKTNQPDNSPVVSDQPVFLPGDIVRSAGGLEAAVLDVRPGDGGGALGVRIEGVATWLTPDSLELVERPAPLREGGAS